MTGGPAEYNGFWLACLVKLPSGRELHWLAAPIAEAIWGRPLDADAAALSRDPAWNPPVPILADDLAPWRDARLVRRIVNTSEGIAAKLEKFAARPCTVPADADALRATAAELRALVAEVTAR